MVPTIAVIPVKSFSGGKLRLSSVVDDAGRLALGRALAAHVADIAASCDLVPLIVTSDSEVATWATTSGFPSLADSGDGLDAAAADGAAWAQEARSHWLIVHADLPLLTRDDLVAVSSVDGDVIAPSSDGGTSVLGASQSIEFGYGPESFHRHLPRLNSPTVVARLGLLHDVDSPSDLESALHHPLGSWLGEYLS